MQGYHDVVAGGSNRQLTMPAKRLLLSGLTVNVGVGAVLLLVDLVAKSVLGGGGTKEK